MASRSSDVIVVLSSSSEESDDDISVEEEIIIDVMSVYDESDSNPLSSSLQNPRNITERNRRREQLNLFKCLHKVLPSATAFNKMNPDSYIVSKQAILKEALEYIARLKLIEAQSQLTVERELQENFTRRQLVRQLQNNNDVRDV